MFAINLGGEGEIPGVMRSSQTGKTFQELVDVGYDFLICQNIPLPFPDELFDVVFTNGVPIDITTRQGPGVQSTEIKRILKSGGRWEDDYGAAG